MKRLILALALLVGLALTQAQTQAQPPAQAPSQTQAPAQSPSETKPELLQAKTFRIADQLRCPVCVSESVAQSSSPISIQMRQIIQEQLEQGRSEEQILGFFQERYGDWILLEPPKRGLHLLVWLLPVAAAITGLTVLIFLLRRWTRASSEPIEADPSDLARVREALAERK